MKEIIHNLFVGDENDGVKALSSPDFYVASMTKEGPVGHRSVLKYSSLGAPKDDNYYFIRRGKHFAGNLIDIGDVNFIPEEVINPALEFIKKYYDAGDKVLVHCERGHSRGPTTMLLFLRSIGEMPYPFKTAEKIFKTLYRKYSPAKGMETYAKQHWNSYANV